MQDSLTRSATLTRLCAAISFLLLWSLGLAAYDTVLAMARARDSHFPFLSFYATAAGTILLVLGPFAILRTWLRARAQRPAQRWLIGALDGAAVANCLCYRADYATIGAQLRWLGALSLVVAGGVAFVMFTHWRRSLRLRAASIALCMAALWLEKRLPFRELDFAHLGLDVLALIALAYGVSGSWSPPLLPSGMGALAALALAVSSIPSLRTSETTRAVVYEQSTHARVHSAALPLRWVVRESESLRPTACSKRRDPCKSRPRAEPSRLDGTLRGADVLMLSIDALRWDHVAALGPLLTKLGESVRFENAFSPAPRTAHSFAAMLRGRPLRQVLPFFERASDVMRGDAPDTLGTVLRQNGYRALYVPAHRFLHPSFGIATGFEMLLSDADQANMLHHAGRTPAAVATASLLRAARDTAGPVFAWMHAMETHHPYLWNGGSGPGTADGQKHAARDLALLLAEFVREFREARGGRPLLTVVLADHGEEFGEHGGYHHSSTLHAEQNHVALLIAAPSLPARTIQAPVSTTAVPSTLLSLLGMAAPCTFTVPSLLACIERDASCPTLVLSELAHPGRTRIVNTAYSTAQHRLLHDVVHETTHLFDLRADPLETRDIAPQRATTIDALKRTARKFDQVFCVPKTKAPRKNGAAKH